MGEETAASKWEYTGLLGLGFAAEPAFQAGFTQRRPRRRIKLRPQSAVIRGITRAIVTEVASYQAMADTLERLKAALADRYAIHEELGSGGMATVYLAEDLKHHRKVAVKVLRPDLAATLGPDRFLREIEVAAVFLMAPVS